MAKVKAKMRSTEAFIAECLTMDTENCVKWPFYRDEFGYGRAYVSGFTSRLAHRIICEMRHGVGKDGRNVVRHLCGNGHLGCVNPNHLDWGTCKDNSGDMIIHGTKPLGTTTGLSVLDDTSVKEIRRLRRQQGLTYRALGEVFKVAVGTIQAVIERRTWRHVNDDDPTLKVWGDDE